MTPSDEIIRTNHLPQFGGFFCDLKNQYKILLNIVKKKIFLEFMMPIKTFKKIETIVLYFVIKKNLEISFQNGPEHETTSLTTVWGGGVHFYNPDNWSYVKDFQKPPTRKWLDGLNWYTTDLTLDHFVVGFFTDIYRFGVLRNPSQFSPFTPYPHFANLT